MQELPTELITLGGPWVFIAYIIIREVLPKIVPQIFERNAIMEERLFKLLEQNSEHSKNLCVALAALEKTQNIIAERLEKIDGRLDDVEDLVKR